MPNYVRDVCSSAWQLLSLKHVVMCTALNWNELKTNKCIGDDMKGADHRSPNCIRKTKKYVLWNVNICPLLQFCENLFPRQNFTEIGQSHVELWSKTFFNMAAVHHIEFKKNHIWPRDCHRVPNMLLCIKFHQNLKSDDFSLRYGDFTIFVK